MSTSPAASSTGGGNSRPPNVILLMADQLRADALGFAGNPIVHTPHLDRLAASGVVCERMFVQTPVCMASRASILTGRYPRSLRVRSMGLLRGGAGTGYERVTCELDQLPTAYFVPSYTVRSEEWKLEYFPQAHTGMLFHLREDPEELHNLFFDSGCASVRHELLLDLLDLLYTTKDPLPVRLSQA